MANLPENPAWEAVYQYETTDPLEGGANGIDNKQGKNLVNRTAYLKARQDGILLHGEAREGRNLFDVLGVTTVADAMAALRARCNGTGLPDFSNLRIGDYLDLPSISIDGTVYTKNDTYKNTRIVISGFNAYKGAGDTENTKNHLLFIFRNILMSKRMNPTDANAGGYPASELRAWLEGANGNGTGDYSGGGVTTAAFLNGLKAALGDYLYTIRKIHSIKGTYGWNNFTVWLPTEIEVFGYQTWGDEANTYNTNVQFPIFAESMEYRIKRLNGSRMWWWESTPFSASAASFCSVDTNGTTNYLGAGVVGGVAPAFCIA